MTDHCLILTLYRLSFRAALSLVCCAAASWACSVGAAEIILQNDSIASPGAGTPLLQFVQGEKASAWLTTPVAGDIVGVQILWDANFGSGNPSQETSITVSAAGQFPTPGAPLAVVLAPSLNDATVNEFRHLDPPINSVAMQVPVTAGQTVVVALEFLNQSAGNPFASGVEFDGDGCLSNSNSVFAIPGGWLDACGQGVTGDFGIRAIVRPVPEPKSAVILLVAVAALSAVTSPRTAKL